jgi:hypothetical protein
MRHQAWIGSILVGLCLAVTIQAQPACVIDLSLVNHNRYVYDSTEECGWFFHTSPWGNWGVNSNVGTRLNTDQFQGWRQPCSQTKVEWNSCTNRSKYRTADFLNFPSLFYDYPFPRNGYPFADPFPANDLTPPYGTVYNVDQYSPCGANAYGGVQLVLPAAALRDPDGDGIYEAGGCAVLDGQRLTMQQNFMSLYELDTPDPDDLIESLHFPDLSVVLRCTPNICVALGDEDRDGWPDDLNDAASPQYQWPVLYQDQWGAICRPDDPNVPCKRIDATIRVGKVLGHFLEQGIPSLPFSYETPGAFTKRPVGATRIVGRAVDGNTGLPLQAELGLILRGPGGITLRHLRASEEGLFEISALTAGDVLLTTKLEGYAAERRGFSMTNSEIRSLELHLLRTGIVRGSIVDSTGTPIEHARIRVVYEENRAAPRALSASYQWEWGEVRTDAEGRFLVEVHPDKAFVIEATHPGFLAEISSPVESASAVNDASLRLTLSRGERLEGVVQDAAGQAIAGALLELSANAQWPGLRRFISFALLEQRTLQATTDEKGRYEFACVPAAAREMIISHPKYQPLHRVVPSASERRWLPVVLTPKSLQDK